MILSIYGLITLNFKSYGTFGILKKLHNFLAGLLPTTEIIELEMSIIDKLSF